MFSINQIHSEKRISELNDEDFIVCFDAKRVLMNLAGNALPKVRDLRSLLDGDAILMQGGAIDGVPCWGIQATLPEGGSDLSVVECRTAFLQPTDDIMNAISRCREFTQWRNAHKFCGGCCEPLMLAEDDLALVCPKCRKRYYPQLAPAVIVAVTRNGGRELLMAHNKRFVGNTYSIIAGFVEAGESVEQAVHREILEETGITVKNIRYLYSQPWPFPNSLMLGFTAEYESGEPTPVDGELTDIQWFTRDNFPQLPAPGSIAYKIINQL